MGKTETSEKNEEQAVTEEKGNVGAETAVADTTEGEVAEGSEKPNSEDARFADLTENNEGGSPRSLEFILDIPLKVTVELGRAKMLINDLLQLTQGSVIELNKLAGEPLAILANDKLIARGEVVVVNEKFGVRLTDIISPMERIEKLK